jgi:molecular chaperone DnaJ
MRNLYEVLGVSEGASPDEIRRAYRRLVRRCHPDVAGERAAGAFREVHEAYDTLGDEARRREYDGELARRRHVRVRRVEPEIEWRPDEIAVDFPSVSSLMSRIGEAFLGTDEFSLPLSAEVLVSAREAYYGVKVPLDVPVRRTCPLCGGRGETWMEPCARCAGTGEALFQHRVTVSVPAGVPDGARFRFSVGTPSAPPTHIEVRVAIRSHV